MDKVTVTEADRQRADDILKRLADWIGEQTGKKFTFADREGDNCDMRQAFAAHRRAAMLEGVRLGLEAAAKADSGAVFPCAPGILDGVSMALRTKQEAIRALSPAAIVEGMK